MQNNGDDLIDLDDDGINKGINSQNNASNKP